jgi:hypothetical protein
MGKWQMRLKTNNSHDYFREQSRVDKIWNRPTYTLDRNGLLLGALQIKRTVARDQLELPY